MEKLNRPPPDSGSTFKTVNQVVDSTDKVFAFFEKRKWLVRFVTLGLLGGGSVMGYQQHQELAAYKNAVTVNVTTDDGAKTMVVDNYAKETRRMLLELKEDYETTKRNFH